MFRQQLLRSVAVFAPPDDKGAGDKGAGDKGAGDKGTGGDGYTPPDGIPTHLVGKDDRETATKIFAAYAPLHAEQSKREPIPKDATGYKFEAPDNLKTYFGNADDPVLSLAREAALKNGMPPKMFQQFIADTFGPAVQKGLLGPIFDPAKETALIGKLIGAPEGEAGKQPITAALTEAAAVAKALTARIKLPDGVSADVKEQIGATIAAIADMPGGVVLLRQLKADYAERGIKLGGEAATGGGKWTADSIKAAMKEERYDPYSPKYDKAWRAEVDAAAKNVLG